MNVTLEITLFGTCVARVTGDVQVELRGAKHRALVALLATAPLGRRTRTYLQTTLWGYAGYDSGHQNLRRALADMRKTLGPVFDTLFHTTNGDVELDLDHVRYVGDPCAGLFLEDLNVHEAGFVEWLASIRAAPDQVAALYRISPKTRTGRPRPCVTALPLLVLGDDPSLPVLGDWVAEEICRTLSRSNLLSVISHLSSRAMVQRRVDIAEIRKTLAVDYLLTGSLRKQGSEYIAEFDFVDARTGNILWNRHLSSPAPGFTEGLQGRLVNVVQSIGRSIADSTIQHVRSVTLEKVEDHQLVVAGVTLMHRSPLRDFLGSRDFLTEAVARMPLNAEARAWLGKWYVLSVFKGLSTDPKGDTQKALANTARALDIDPESSFGLTIDGFANNNLLKNMDIAESRYAAALDVNPNESLSWLLRGALMAFQDDGAAAIRAADTARRLSPIDPFGYYYDSLSSTAYLAAEDYERALEFADRSLAKNDRHISTLRARITALHYLDRGDEARAAADDLLRRFPDFSLHDYRGAHPSADHRLGRRVISALAAAGLDNRT